MVYAEVGDFGAETVLERKPQRAMASSDFCVLRDQDSDTESFNKYTSRT